MSISPSKTLARTGCVLLGLSSIPASLFGGGIVLGPLAFLWANWLATKKGNWMTDAGGLAGLIGFGLSLAFLYAGPDRRASDDWKWIGKPAPDFEVVDIAGDSHRLSNLEGQRVLIVFWGVNCPPCIREIPYFIELAQDSANTRTQILAISSNPKKWLEKAVTKKGINYPVISLATSGNRLGPPYNEVVYLPTLMVVGPDGTFEAVRVGALSRGEIWDLARGSDS